MVDTEAEEEDGEWIYGSEEDLARVFPEIKAKPADPVGIPLPATHSDAPTIPPAYDAKCVKSDFFNEDNQRESSRPIQETPMWSEARWDPIFKRHAGMVMLRFPGYDADYPTYPPPSPMPPADKIRMPPQYQLDRDRRGSVEPEVPLKDPSSVRGGLSWYSPDNANHRDSPGRLEWSGRDHRHAKRSRDQSLEDFDRGSRDNKRSRNLDSRRRTSSDSRSGRDTPSPQFKVEVDPWSPQPGESGVKASNDHRYLEVHNDNKSSSSREERAPYNKNARHDSGYLSGQSLDKARTSHRSEERHRPLDRSRQRQKSPSRSRSRASSGAERSERSRSESPLTALEAELLGLTDEPTDRPKPKAKLKKPVQRVQVAAAYRYGYPTHAMRSWLTLEQSAVVTGRRA